MLRRRQQQPPATPVQGPDAPDEPSTAISTSAEGQTTQVSGRPGKVPGVGTKDAGRGPDIEGGDMEINSASERSPLLDGTARGNGDNLGQAPSMIAMAWSRRNQWMLFAIASGACAALNGVMAKLTTTELTTSLSQHIAGFLGLSNAAGAVEFVVRATFFGMNLAFNGVMWTLFTQALARGHSTTQVSIMNTSSNFVLTALLGLAIFSESLPPLWWVGASMLVAGNVIIGRKDEGSTGRDEADDPGADAVSEAESGRSDYEHVPQTEGVLFPEEKDEEDEDVPQLGDLESR